MKQSGKADRTPWLGRAALWTVLALTCAGSFSCAEPTEATSQPEAPLVLDVALYPYVPNPGIFQTELVAAWNQLGYPVTLNFVTNNTYKEDPPPSLEVFVFDGVFLSHFADAGVLRPFAVNEIDAMSDYLPYAINGSTYNGQFYGLPQIGCTNILYYRSGDQGMAAVQSLTDLWNTLGPATYTWPKPPQGQGFMMNFSGGTTAACTYVAAYESYYDSYSIDPPLPSVSNLDPNVMSNLGLMVQMAGPAQAAYYQKGADYIRADWFNTGAGRAMVGFTEAMSHMPNIVSSVQFKAMPLGGNPDFELFYVDVVGVNKSVIGTPLEKYAVALANLLASEDYLVDCFSNANATAPQYLMPVRTSVLGKLAAGYAQYAAISAFVSSSNPRFFRLGPNSRTWLKANKDGIQQQILGLGAGVEVEEKEGAGAR